MIEQTPKIRKPKTTAPDQNLPDQSRRAMLHALGAAGLSALLNVACNANEHVTTNLDIIENTDEIPEGLKRKDYLEEKEINPQQLKTFFKILQETFVLDLSKILSWDGKQFICVLETESLKQEINQQLAKRYKHFEVEKALTVENWFGINFQIAGLKYGLRIINNRRLEISIGDLRKQISIEGNSLVLTKPLDEQMNIEFMQTSNQTTVINPDNGSLQIEAADHSFIVFNTESLIAFLKHNRDKGVFAKDLHVFPQEILDDLLDLNQLAELVQQMPADDLESFANFYTDFIAYADKDQTVSDTFKNPARTFLEHSGDCDDYAALNAFWGKLFGYNVQLVELQPKPNVSKDFGGHVITVLSKNDQILIGDNSLITSATTLEAYLSDKWPMYKIEATQTL